MARQQDWIRSILTGLDPPHAGIGDALQDVLGSTDDGRTKEPHS